MIRIKIDDRFDFDKAISELLIISGSVPVTVTMSDGDVVMSHRPLIFHMLYWKVAHKWGIRVSQRYIIDVSIITYNTFSTLSTLILDDVRMVHPNSYRSIIYDFAEVMNKISNLTIRHCQAYHRSLDIVDLARIDLNPEVQAITSQRINDPNMPMEEAEKKFKGNVSKLFALLKIPKAGNAIWPFINLQFVSEDQLAHIFYQIGYRTDIDDTIIRYPVQGNYLNGLKNYIEYALEALSSKKSVFYNKESIPFADYFGRLQHLLLSCLSHLYPGDCETKIYLTVDVTKANHETLLYKNIVEQGMLITLDRKNIKSYIGKQIKMRSPLGCRYTNGVCEACAGKLISSIAPGIHIGIYAALQTTEKIVQVILSSKHLQRTNSIAYNIPPELCTMMMRHKDGIYVTPSGVEKWKKVQLVFDMKDAVRFANISEMDMSRVSAIDEVAFGNVSRLMLMKNNEAVTDMINLQVGDQAPRYSRNFIKYVADNPDKVQPRDELFIVDLKDFDFEKPLFKITTVNLAMVNFVKAAKKLLETQIGTYTSGAELYNDFTRLVRTQVNVNTIYLELVLRASMIRTELDVRLPVVEDLDVVKFGTNDKLNFERSLGVLAAFEQLPKETKRPDWYLTPKLYSRFDEFLNLKPRP